MFKNLKLLLTPFDARFEDLRRGDVRLNVLRDFTAGLIVAMVAIPLAMGLAMASGLRPEQGIIGGAVAGLLGAIFGGSKYQVYGPTAAFIPVIGGIMATHGHGYLVMCSLFAGAVLIVMGVARLGKIVKLVPHSIVVGFTIGIAVTIALSYVGEVLGLKVALGYKLMPKLRGLAEHFGEANVWAFVLAIGTLVTTRVLLKVSVFLPAPLIALGLGAVLAQTALKDAGLSLIRDKYGKIPPESWAWTPPDFSHLTLANAPGILYAVAAIVFVAAIESLLCSRLADRLAQNKGTPFHPDKELWGQGWVMALVPLFNGFPHTGALARTATNIKLGALSPLAGIFKGVLKLAIAYYLAHYLELVPVACIGGLLLFVASNMVKADEVKEVLHLGRFHIALMLWTAGAVIATDFLTGVLSALALFGVGVMMEKMRAPKTATADARHAPTAPAHAEMAPAARAVIASTGHEARAHKLPPVEERGKWLANIRQRALVAPTTFVHQQASVIGRVVLGDNVHVAAGSSVRADEGGPFFIGADTNIQDGVVIHALKDKFVRVGGDEWAVYVGKNVSIAHDALVHGPCFVGDHSFIGFKAVVHDAVIGPRCYIGIGAVVVGVEVPEGRFVPHGEIIDSPEKAQALPPVTDAHSEFNHDVVEVNRGLAAAYREVRSPTRPVALPARAAGLFDAGWEPPEPAPSDRF